MRSQFLYALSAMLLVACVQPEPTTTATPTATPTPTSGPTGASTLVPGSTPMQSNGVGKLRFLALGDSYTIGHSVDISERWPFQLVQILRMEGLAVAEPEFIARTGWTTQELSLAIERADPQAPYAVVTLMIGVNNQFRGQDVKEYQEEFVDLLQRGVELTGGDASRVIVVSIPDWSVTPFALGRDRAQIAEQIELFNDVNSQEANRCQVRGHYICFARSRYRSQSPERRWATLFGQNV